MSFETLRNVDTSRWDEPDPKSDLREFLEAWLDYQRHEFIRKLRDLDRTQLVTWSIPPVELSVLGLVRHMTQMEHNWLTWGLGGGDRVFRYGEDDYAGASIATIDDDLSWFFEEIATANAAVAEMSSLEEVGTGHGRSLQATLVKMIDEYALHAGQAHMLRFAALGDMIRQRGQYRHTFT